MHHHGIFDAACGSGAIHVRRHSNGFREIGDPEREINERITVLEECSSTCLGTPESPPGAGCRELILPRPHTDEAPQLTALQKAIELLYITAEAMVVADDDFSSGLLSRSENALDTTRRQRQRPLAEHINL